MTRKSVDLSRCYTPEQLAERWLVHPRTVKRMIDQGRLRAFCVGDAKSRKCRYRISPEELIRFEANGINAAGELIEGQRQDASNRFRKATPLPAVTQWIK